MRRRGVIIIWFRVLLVKPFFESFQAWKQIFGSRSPSRFPPSPPPRISSSSTTTATTTAPGQDRATKLSAVVIVSTLLQGSSWSLELAAESALDFNEDDVVFWKSLECTNFCMGKPPTRGTITTRSLSLNISFCAWFWRKDPTWQQCVPKGLDDVGGNSGATFVRVGLPGEGDCVFGHLSHDRFLRRPRKLDKLWNPGRWINSVFWCKNRRGVVTLPPRCFNFGAFSEEQQVWFDRRRGVTLAWGTERLCECERRDYLWQSESRSSSTPPWRWRRRTCKSPNLFPAGQKITFKTH